MLLAPKNYINNPSGQDGFAGWDVLKEGANEWTIQKKPEEGGEDLPPPDPVYFGLKDRSYFVTSHGLCSKTYLVDFLSEGLFASAMVSILPMEIVCSQIYAFRDCGGKGSWRLSILDENKEILKSHEEKFEGNDVGCKEIDHSFKFSNQDELLVERIRYLEFKHEGTNCSRALKLWSGNYGIKFARACVKVQPSKESIAPAQGASTPACEEPFNLEDNQLNCPVCLELPRKEVYQCRNGHTVCHECSSNLTSCPQCREEYEGNRIRNRAMEFVLENVAMECCYREKGCTVTILRKRLSQHETACEFRNN